MNKKTVRISDKSWNFLMKIKKIIELDGSECDVKRLVSVAVIKYYENISVGDLTEDKVVFVVDDMLENEREEMREKLRIRIDKLLDKKGQYHFTDKQKKYLIKNIDVVLKEG